MDKIKIYFLFHSKAFWPSWETFWNACNEDPRITTKMIFCPTINQDKGCNGQFIDSEDWLISNKISYTNVKNVNFKKEQPNIIVIQTPYPYHRKSKYLSSEFKKIGIKPIYISYGLEFAEAQENIFNHFKLPIHINSWRIFTASPLILNDFQKYCPVGNSHVRYLGHPKFDYIFNKNHFHLPSEIIEKAKGRKIVVWKVHFPMKIVDKKGKQYNSTFSWENDKKILSYIKKQKDLFFVFLPHHLFFGVLQYKFNISIDEINKFKQNLENNENSTIWYDDYRPIISHCDAFMGERSSVTFEMIAYNKPVLYLEEKPETYNDFGKTILKSYDITRTFKEIPIFLNKFRNGIDDKENKRVEAFNKVFPNIGGNSGYRIKEDIINELENETKINKLNSKIQTQRKTIHIVKIKIKKNKAEFDTIREKYYNQLHDSKFFIPYKIWHSNFKKNKINEFP